MCKRKVRPDGGAIQGLFVRSRAPKTNHAPGTRDPRSESGLTLVELLVTMTMLGGIMAALAGIFTTTGPAAGRDQSRALGIMDAQAGLAAMTRDLRQAQTINSA